MLLLGHLVGVIRGCNKVQIDGEGVDVNRGVSSGQDSTKVMGINQMAVTINSALALGEENLGHSLNIQPSCCQGFSSG